LQAGIVPSVLQGQWRESFKGTHYLLNLHQMSVKYEISAQRYLFFSVSALFKKKKCPYRAKKTETHNS